jgi:PAS domain S-box-containing protein
LARRISSPRSLQTVGQPVWVVDPEGLIRCANPAAVATLGYESSNELLGRHSHETIHFAGVLAVLIVSVARGAPGR